MKSFLLYLFLLSLSTSLQAQTIRFVKAGATGQGTSWNDAGDFQNLINESADGDSLFVAGGVYQPSANTSFRLKEGVKIYGSFAGTETSLSLRNLAANLAAGDSSVLKGNGNSVVASFHQNGDNIEPAVLNGFIITGGKATMGAGIYNELASPDIINCIFRGNNAEFYGGGLVNNGGAPNIINCLFFNNKGRVGGAIANTSGYPHFTNITVIGDGTGDIYAYGWMFWKNCIIWGAIDGDDFDADYSLISSDKALDGKNGNIDARAWDAGDIFTDLSGGDYTLLPTSPAVDAGSLSADTAGLNLPLIDLAGQPRFFNDRIDMGAFEFQMESTVPIVIQSFRGQLQNGTAHLEWQSGLETSFKQYELEKSQDGTSYHHLATISATGSNSSYYYMDSQTQSIAYYRLKLTDNNGSSTFYKKIITLTQKPTASFIKLYPIPARNDIYIQVEKVGSVQIYDLSGRQVKTQPLKKGLNSISVQNFSAGLYYAIINGIKQPFIIQ